MFVNFIVAVLKFARNALLRPEHCLSSFSLFVSGVLAVLPVFFLLCLLGQFRMVKLRIVHGHLVKLFRIAVMLQFKNHERCSWQMGVEPGTNKAGGGGGGNKVVRNDRAVRCGVVVLW